MPDIVDTLESVATARKVDPLVPVTFIVPSHLAGLHLRRRLAEFGPFAAVRFETLPRLAELLAAGKLAAEGRQPLARPIGDYLTEQIALDSRGVLGRVKELPGYARALRVIFRRLRRGGIRSSSDLPGQTGARFSEILVLYDSFRRATEQFYDDCDLLDAATEVVRNDGRSASDIGAIHVVAPAGETAGAAALLDALRMAGTGYSEVGDQESSPATRLVLSPNRSIEAREVVREVLSALDDGLSLQEIAVFYGADASYPRLLREAFAGADIPAVPMPGIPLIETPAGRTVYALAKLPSRKFSRTGVLDFLNAAPLPPFLSLADRKIAPMTSTWDRLSRVAGITRGADRWSSALQAFVANRRRRAADYEGSGEDVRAAAAIREADHARDLADIASDLVSRLSALDVSRPAIDFLSEFREIVKDYVASDDVSLADVIDEIDRLGAVGAVGGEYRLSRFAESLRVTLEQTYARPRALGEGVLVADHRLAAGLRFKRVIICGAYAGAFPAGPGSDSLVDSGTWSGLRAMHPLVEDADLRIKRAEDAARRAIAAGSGGSVVLTSPLREPGGSRRYYPGAKMVAAARKEDTKIDTASALRILSTREWLRRNESPLASMVKGAVLDAAELSLRAAVTARINGSTVPQRYARSLDALRCRRSDRFTEWDGNVSTLSNKEWLELQRAVSPTSLENYAVCGYRYFCASLLRIDSVDEPEERETMDAGEKGSLVHSVLHKFLEAKQSEGRPAPYEEWKGDDLDHIIDLLNVELKDAESRGITGLGVYAKHDSRMIRADLATFLDRDSVFRRETGAVPSEFEIYIPEVEVAGVRLRGKVDRIDRSPDGKQAWVIDYKTGSRRDFDKKITLDDPLSGGTKLQLPTYLEAIREVEEAHAAYWFISQKGGFDFVGYEASAENRSRFEGTITATINAIRAGAFPAIPAEEDEHYGKFGNCRFCDFDRICSRRRDHEYAAKASDVDVTPWRNVGETARGTSP